MAQTDDDIRQQEAGRLQTATSFRIHASYPDSARTEPLVRSACRTQLQSWLAQCGCDAYAIVEVHGCWDHWPEPGLVVERIYPEGRTTVPPGILEVAETIQMEWEQEEVWITRTEIELAVIA